MSRHKLKKFAQLQSFPNYYDNLDIRDPKSLVLNGEIVDIKGRWLADYFKNDNPITLELACGRGEYAVALGRMFPERNFIGVDIKGSRIHQGATTAIEEGLSNVAFLRTRIEIIEHFFAKNEVSEIWITFPDPFLRDTKADKRLTSVPFLNRYRTFLQPEGIIHLKTDSPDLYDFTLQICENMAHPDKVGTEGVSVLFNDDDIHAKPLIMNELSVQTYYEKANIAKSTIKYVRFKI
jgi:tRNA (guanine-N7-)-methyltransferase